MDHHPIGNRDLTGSIIRAFYEVYNTLGYGLIETLYAAALEREPLSRGHSVAREFAVDVTYKGHPIGFQRLDMVVDSAVVVEIKATPTMHQVFKRQLICYLHATGIRTGLLLHFGPDPRVFRLYARRPPAVD